MPRKVFLNKSDEPTPPAQQPARPPVPAKPSAIPPTVQTKPTPPTKPKPPPKKPKPNTELANKTKDLDAANANNSPPRTENRDNVANNLAGGLQDLDILKYIEQEEKSLDAQLNLFEWIDWWMWFEKAVSYLKYWFRPLMLFELLCDLNGEKYI